MRTRGNEIIIRRNESFTIDKYIVNKDGSPFIISSELQNPYFLLTIASARYDQKNRYIKRYWLEIGSDFPRFRDTTVVHRDLAWNDFSDMVEPLANVLYEHNGEYKYSVRVNDSHSSWEDYECRLIKPFSVEDTSEWVEQEYLYSLQLVAGVTMSDRLLQLWDKYIGDYKETIVDRYLNDYGLTEDGVAYVYKILSSKKVKELEGLDPTDALYRIDYDVPILHPTKLSVLFDLYGGF